MGTALIQFIPSDGPDSNSYQKDGTRSSKWFGPSPPNRPIPLHHPLALITSLRPYLIPRTSKVTLEPPCPLIRHHLRPPVSIRLSSQDQLVRV